MTPLRDAKHVELMIRVDANPEIAGDWIRRDRTELIAAAKEAVQNLEKRRDLSGAGLIYCTEALAALDSLLTEQEKKP